MDYITPKGVIESREEKDKNYPNECLMRIRLIPNRSPKHHKNHISGYTSTYWTMEIINKNI